MRVGIIGAGVAGLTTAKVLTQAGHEVVVYDKAPDVGGVWSRTRRYPGLTTQSPKAQYSLSDFPMPRDYPEWPTGAQVQAYLAAYASHFGLDPALRLSTEVTSAVPAPGGGWTVTAAGIDRALRRLVVANGVFCEPAVPRYPGEAEFTAAGGQVLAGTELHDEEQARGKRVLVVGYGKSACDVTVPVSAGGGEHRRDRQAPAVEGAAPDRRLPQLQDAAADPDGRGPVQVPAPARRGEVPARAGQPHARQHDQLDRVGVGPPVRAQAARAWCRPGRWRTSCAARSAWPPRASSRASRPAASWCTRTGPSPGCWPTAVSRPPNSTTAPGCPADLIVCATGFTQGVPFLPADVTRRVLDERGNFMLYRQIRPVDVPGLYFNGYNSSFFSPLNAEMAAIWIAADLAGAVALPAPAAMRQQVADQLAFMDDATDSHHCHGGKIIPFSLHNVDEVLGDLGVNISAAVRAWHWLMPVDPAAYRQIAPAVLRRLPSVPARASAVAAPEPVQ